MGCCTSSEDNVKTNNINTSSHDKRRQEEESSASSLATSKTRQIRVTDENETENDMKQVLQQDHQQETKENIPITETSIEVVQNEPEPFVVDDKEEAKKMEEIIASGGPIKIDQEENHHESNEAREPVIEDEQHKQKKVEESIVVTTTAVETQQQQQQDEPSGDDAETTVKVIKVEVEARIREEIRPEENQQLDQNSSSSNIKEEESVNNDGNKEDAAELDEALVDENEEAAEATEVEKSSSSSSSSSSIPSLESSPKQSSSAATNIIKDSTKPSSAISIIQDAFEKDDAEAFLEASLRRKKTTSSEPFVADQDDDEFEEEEEDLLSRSIQGGKTNIVRLLINSALEDNNNKENNKVRQFSTKPNEHGQSPLYTAVFSNDFETTKLILENSEKLGIDINLADKKGNNTSFMIACSLGRKEIVDLFLASTSSSSKNNNDHSSRQHLDLNVQHTKSKRSALHLAIFGRHFDIASRIVKHAIDENESFSRGSKQHSLAMMSLVDINIQDSEGNTPLNQLCQLQVLDNEDGENGNDDDNESDFDKKLNLLETLLDHPLCEVEKKNFSNQTPLYSCVFTNDLDAVEIFINKTKTMSMSTNTCNTDELGNNLLHLSVRMSYFDMLKLLVFGRIFFEEDSDSDEEDKKETTGKKITRRHHHRMFLSHHDILKKNLKGETPYDLAMKMRELLEVQAEDENENEEEDEQQQYRFEENEKIIALLKAFKNRKD